MKNQFMQHMNNWNYYLGRIGPGPGSRGPGTNTNWLFSFKLGNSETRL